MRIKSISTHSLPPLLSAEQPFLLGSIFLYVICLLLLLLLFKCYERDLSHLLFSTSSRITRAQAIYKLKEGKPRTLNSS